MPIIRTIDGAIEYLKQLDSGCALTRNALRRMIVTGQFKCAVAGNKYLVDCDKLLKFLQGGEING